MENTEIARREEAASPISMFLAEPERLNALDVEKVAQLFELHERWVEREAKREYAEAFNRVQSNMEPVRRTAEGSQGGMYAKAEDVARMLDPLLIEHGFSWSLSTVPIPPEEIAADAKRATLIRHVLTVRHIGGHSQDHFMDAPADTHGPKGGAVKSQLHGRGSSMTYCGRYLRCNVFGVQLVKDDDGDAASDMEGAELIGTDAAWGLAELAERAGADPAKALEYYKVSALHRLTPEQAQHYRDGLEQRMGS